MVSSLKSIALGKSKVYGECGQKFDSAYKKDQFFNYIEIDEYGIVGDIQVDKRYHGGIDKAIHMGSTKHFDIFSMDKLAMGCNILIDSFDENDINVGDIYKIGDIELQVTQPRQPCWKIGALFGKETSRYIIKNQATGWYLKVLEAGIIDINDKLVLKERLTDLTIKQLSTYLHTPPKDQKLINKILSCDTLAQVYKDDLQQKL